MEENTIQKAVAMRFIRTIALAMLTLVLATASSRAADQSVKVFFLVGQSNMEGKGNPAHIDTYKDDALIKPTYAGLKDGDQWRVRDDVWITYPSKARGAKHGSLTVGNGTKGDDSIGPEFGFGHTVGNAIAEPVLLIKIAWGGKSLSVDFRPPSAPPSEDEVAASLERARKKKPQTSADDVKESYGVNYRKMILHAQEELENVGTRFPKLKGKELELAGFVWHQGFNDIINRKLRETKYADYTKWLESFIHDVRKDLGAPNLPFVIGELGHGGVAKRGDFQAAQAKAAKRDEFQGNVAFVPTGEYLDTVALEYFKKGFWKRTATDEQKAQWQAVGNDRPYHCLGSGKTHYLKGQAFAEAIRKMQK